MAKVKTYDPKLVTLVISGVLVTGYSDGTHISIELNEDQNSITVSNDGDVSYNRNPNRTGMLSVEVQSNSDSVRDLMRILASDKIFTCSVLDGNEGGTSTNLIGCKIKNKANIIHAKEVQPITIEVWFADMQIEA